MAIRKFRKNLKPFIWTITIAFLLSLGAGFFAELSRGFGGPKSYAFKVNGQKVEKRDVERAKVGISDMYSKNLGGQLDKNIVTVIGTDEAINKMLTLEIAKKLKISVSSNDVEKEYKEIEKSIPSKEQFKRMLMSQGLTKATLKQEIKQSLIIRATVEYFESSVVPTQLEIEKYYDENKNTKFVATDLKNSEQEIIKEIKNYQGKKNYELALEEARRNMVITDVQEEYKADIPKIEFQKDGFTVSNSDYSRKVLNALFQTRGDKENAPKLATEQFNSEIKLAKIAISRDIKVDDRLPLESKLSSYREQLFESIKKDVKITEKDITDLFKKTKENYNIEESISANIAVMNILPSEKDKIETTKKAEELLKRLTKENFAEEAKKYSDDGGSASKGGELGWFGKEIMIPVFEKAAFTGEVGKIYPQVVTSEFGDHLIYINDRRTLAGKEEVNVSHILLKPKVSEKTKDMAEKNAKEILKKLNSKELTFANLAEKEKSISLSREFTNITKNGYIQGLGYEEKLVKDLFNNELDKIKIEEIGDKIFITEKLSVQNFVEAKLSNPIIHEKVKKEYLNKETYKQMEKFLKD